MKYYNKIYQNIFLQIMILIVGQVLWLKEMMTDIPSLL